MSEVIVIDLAHVTVDGVPAGSVLDVAANYPKVEGIKSLVLAAIQKWSDDREAAHAAALDRLKAQHEAVLQAAQEQAAATADAKVAEIKRQIAEQHSQIDALGGTELGRKLAREKRCREIHDAIAKHQAELATLDGTAHATVKTAQPGA